MNKNQLLNITKDEILFRNLSGEEESVKLIKIDDVNVSSSVNYPNDRVIRNILALAFCILFLWNFSSNYPNKKIENNDGWIVYGRSYQPGEWGTSVYSVEIIDGSFYYNKRIDLFVNAIWALFFVPLIFYWHLRVSKYQGNYNTNLHTITINPKEQTQGNYLTGRRYNEGLAALILGSNRPEKVITVGDYETTKENYLKLKSFLKECF